MVPSIFFFAIDGMRDSLTTARRLVDEANVGFAPGAAFGTAGEGYPPHVLSEGRGQACTKVLARFSRWLENQPAQLSCCLFGYCIAQSCAMPHFLRHDNLSVMVS